MDTDNHHRGNMLDLIYGSGINEITFTYTTYSYTPGQPWNGVTVAQDSSYCRVTVNCGRRASDGPAKVFRASVDTDSETIHTSKHSSEVPSELNFCLVGKIDVKGKYHTDTFSVVVGQGNGNNWHIGCPEISGNGRSGTIGSFTINQHGGWGFEFGDSK